MLNWLSSNLSTILISIVLLAIVISIIAEAGEGEDGRIKSAVGIGALLADGIGDTVRVSLSEEPEIGRAHV